MMGNQAQPEINRIADWRVRRVNNFTNLIARMAVAMKWIAN
jgi:hypothetical protein